MIFTVKLCLARSKLTVAIPLGICFNVAWAVVPLEALVAVGVEAGAEVLPPPHPARIRAAATLRTARRLIFRFTRYFVITIIPFI